MEETSEGNRVNVKPLVVIRSTNPNLTNTLISTILALVSSTKTLPFETTLMVKDRCLCLHVQRAARALARRFDEELRPFELTNGQFSLLMSLNRPEPPPMGPVASLLAMDRTTLDRRAEAAGAPRPG